MKSKYILISHVLSAAKVGKVCKNRMDYGASHKCAMSDELIRIIKFYF